MIVPYVFPVEVVVQRTQVSGPEERVLNQDRETKSNRKNLKPLNGIMSCLATLFNTS
ncbi:MAG: hypothetical protein KGI54_07480 [Pseudomonadota bacterium]|nr:hypothetical protein [Pseudomonadota bacterium]